MEERVPGRGDGHGRLGVQQRRLDAPVRRGVPGLLAHAVRRGLGLVSRPLEVRAHGLGARREEAHDLRLALGEQEDAYLHDELIWCDDTPDGKQSMAVWRREAGLRVRPARKSNMRRFSYEWLAGLREICIDPERCPLTYEEFRFKEYDRDRDGTWVDDIPDGNDHSIDAVRYAMMDDVLRG